MGAIGSNRQQRARHSGVRLCRLCHSAWRRNGGKRNGGKRNGGKRNGGNNGGSGRGALVDRRCGPGVPRPMARVSRLGAEVQFEGKSLRRHTRPEAAHHESARAPEIGGSLAGQAPGAHLGVAREERRHAGDRVHSSRRRHRSKSRELLAHRGSGGSSRDPAKPHEEEPAGGTALSRS
jgi:hypothetical protein